MSYPSFFSNIQTHFHFPYNILLVSKFTLVDFPVLIIDPFNSQVWTEIVARH